MRVSCPCLNLRFTAELSRRSAKKPAIGFQPDVSRSSPTRKPLRGSRDEAFFAAGEESVVENIVAVCPILGVVLPPGRPQTPGCTCRDRCRSPLVWP